MSRLIFLLEEPSMKHFLEGFLPRLLPNLKFLCIPHEGKTDLEKSIPRKLRAWNMPSDKFIIVRDNDGENTEKLEKNLMNLCENHTGSKVMVRIACQELEAWYLGDVVSLGIVYRLTQQVSQQKNPYREPDLIVKPSKLVKKIAPEFQKVDGARRLSKVIEIERNQSKSFHYLIAGIKTFSEMVA